MSAMGRLYLALQTMSEQIEGSSLNEEEMGVQVSVTPPGHPDLNLEVTFKPGKLGNWEVEVYEDGDNFRYELGETSQILNRCDDVENILLPWANGVLERIKADPFPTTPRKS